MLQIIISEILTRFQFLNIFLSGFDPSNNLRFRDYEINFEDWMDKYEFKRESKYEKYEYSYPAMTKSFGSFKLSVESGTINNSEIIVLLGENGTGKTTFIHLLAKIVKPDEKDIILQSLQFSIKPQKIFPKADFSVYSLLNLKIKDNLSDETFEK